MLSLCSVLPKSLLVLDSEDQYASFDDQHSFVCLCLFVLLLCLVLPKSLLASSPGFLWCREVHGKNRNYTIVEGVWPAIQSQISFNL